ncbi:MAG: hypothetical protein NVS3B10_02300 [Polyangiales bacterium]
MHQPAELGEIRGVLDVVDVGELHGDEDGGGAFDGRHGPGGIARGPEESHVSPENRPVRRAAVMAR